MSKEHIFAQWLLKELYIHDNNVTMIHESFNGTLISDRKHSFSKLVNGLVCERCNNGWMSQLEEEVKIHIINLMNIDKIESELKFLNDYHFNVAKWAFKNAILLNNATNYRQLVPDEHYVALYSGNIPEGVFIDLAFCKSESDLEWRQSPGGLVVKDKKIPLSSIVKRYQITFQIKNLLIKVTFYQSSNNVFYENEGAIRIFPEFGKYGVPKIFDTIDDFDIHGVLHEYIDIVK
ncbi:hypothetical protein M4I33_15690 [Clostridium sp. LY3-2]|uniref:hypothetical protein n=1 Tax=Clostridium sp. LY3-2 TaxID=2942482 RepID=UPI002152EAE2|nr:hypothetical protein [Clostridium sp. LY3-2]MCR6516307.1 hypothetical protein [Clostridium sp. LY3-2]